MLAGPPQAPSGVVVKFETSDGVTIEADYYGPKVAAGEPAPVVICAHMYPADRKSWRPLVGVLQAGPNPPAVLAYDIRGRGGSTEPKSMKLREKYAARDPRLFGAAWRDVEAAKAWLAKRRECDVTRVALVGASIGCSISLRYGGRDENVRAIVCLSPGTNYFGVDSLHDVKKCKTASILLIAPEAEYAAVRKLIEASQDRARGQKMPGGAERHGTNLFAADYERRDSVLGDIAKFVGDGLKDK
jgi:pimeloyl-ACP methyl ester carboxylesterase